MKRKRFKRTAIASSEKYVIKSHIAFIQEHLKGTYSSKEIIEAQISISKQKHMPTYWVKCFGVEIQISVEEVKKLKNIIVIER